MRRISVVAGLMTTLVAASPVAGHAQAIDTNRPGFSFAVSTVAPGEWQLESGLAWNEPGDDNESWSLPAFDFRIGLAPELELYVNNINWQNTRQPIGGDLHGWVDPAVGVKWRLDQGEGPLGVALLGQLSIPLGDDAYSSDRWDPAVALAWSLATAIPLAGTARVTFADNEMQVDNGLKLPLAIGDRQVVFAEWEANLREDSDDAHWLNAGYQFLLGDDRQLDVNAGLGLNDAAGDVRLGAGFSMRF